MKFVVLVGARSVRNEEARRQGAGRDIGTYEMLDRVQKLLIGKQPIFRWCNWTGTSRTWSHQNNL